MAKRYHAHKMGKGGKYTRSFKPIKVAQVWKIIDSKALAMQLERHIKKLSRLEKEKIILNPMTLSRDERVCLVDEISFFHFHSDLS